MSEEEFFALDSFELNPSPAYQHKVVTPKMIYDEINLAMDGYNFFLEICLHVGIVNMFLIIRKKKL